MLHNVPSDIAECIDVTSRARLSSYCDFFNVGISEAYSIYKWNDELSSRLMQLIGTVEIILRNRIHEALVKELRLNLPNHQQLDDRWYSYINSEPETISKLNAALKNRNGRAKRPEPSSNQVISKMSFGFWPNILKNTTFFLYKITIIELIGIGVLRVFSLVCIAKIKGSGTVLLTVNE